MHAGIRILFMLFCVTGMGIILSKLSSTYRGEIQQHVTTIADWRQRLAKMESDLSTSRREIQHHVDPLGCESVSSNTTFELEKIEQRFTNRSGCSVSTLRDLTDTPPLRQ